MNIFNGLRRKKNEIKKEPQKIGLEKLEKTITPHKPEPKGVDTEIHKKEWKVGDKLHNRYEVKKVLKGGMGVVYIVLDHELNQLFAAKTYQDKFLWNEEIINRFMAEAETWVNLERHINIVFANFVQKIEGKPLIFLEYMDGGDLSQFIGQMDIPQALDFTIQFCTSMDYAYTKLGIIHRDIKSGNVMVARDDRFRFGYAFKVTDFGLVKALGEAYVESFLEAPSVSVSTGMGTWPYMPPEQFPERIQARFSFKPKPITARTDIYSLGVTFYEVLTGRLPFYNPPRDGRIPSETTLNEIYTKSPINPGDINAQIPEGLDELIMKCLEKNPEDRYKNFRELREELIEIYNDYTGEEYVIIGKKEPLTEIDWSNRGYAFISLDKNEEAIKCCDKALDINPGYTEAWTNKGFALLNLRRNEEAIKCCDKALATNPRFAEAWHNKGGALLKLGRYKEAIKCIDEALDINPRFAEAWHNKGGASGELGRNEEAIKCYDEALAINPRLAEAWHDKGGASGKLGRNEEAIKCYDKALAINPRYADAWDSKGLVLGILERYEEAIECYDKALAINPRYADAWDSKGLVLGILERYEEAIECFDKDLEINPRYADAWYSKGLALRNLGRNEEAIECFQSFIKRAPPQYASRVKQLKELINQLRERI